MKCKVHFCALLLWAAASLITAQEYGEFEFFDEAEGVPPLGSNEVRATPEPDSEVASWLPGVPKGDLDLARDAIETDPSLSSHLPVIINDTYGGDVSHVRHILEMIASFSQQSVVERALLALYSAMADNDDLVTNELVVFSQEVLRYINDTDSSKLKHLYSQIKPQLDYIIKNFAYNISSGDFDDFKLLCVDKLETCRAVLPAVISEFFASYMADMQNVDHFTNLQRFITSLQDVTTQCTAHQALLQSISNSQSSNHQMLQVFVEDIKRMESAAKCGDLLKNYEALLTKLNKNDKINVELFQKSDDNLKELYDKLTASDVSDKDLATFITQAFDNNNENLEKLINLSKLFKSLSQKAVILPQLFDLISEDDLNTTQAFLLAFEVYSATHSESFDSETQDVRDKLRAVADSKQFSQIIKLKSQEFEQDILTGEFEEIQNLCRQNWKACNIILPLVSKDVYSDKLVTLDTYLNFTRSLPFLQNLCVVHVALFQAIANDNWSDLLPLLQRVKETIDMSKYHKLSPEYKAMYNNIIPKFPIQLKQLIWGELKNCFIQNVEFNLKILSFKNSGKVSQKVLLTENNLSKWGIKNMGLKFQFHDGDFCLKMSLKAELFRVDNRKTWCTSFYLHVREATPYFAISYRPHDDFLAATDQGGVHFVPSKSLSNVGDKASWTLKCSS